MLKLLLQNGPLCHDMALERTLSRVLLLASKQTLVHYAICHGFGENVKNVMF